MTTQIVTVTTEDDARTEGNILYAGTYRIEIPADYDPELVTGEDILCDPAIRVVDEMSAYAEMASDEAREADAEAWSDALLPDVSDDTR